MITYLPSKKKIPPNDFIMSMFRRQIVNTEHPYQCLKTGSNKKRLESSSITRDYKRSSIKSVPKSDNNPPFPVSRITLSLEYEKKKKLEKILFEAAASR